MGGILDGLRVIEMASIGPGPFCGMLLADHGAEVIRIDRPGGSMSGDKDVLARGRKSVVVNLKTSEGIQIVRELAKTADGFFEGLRPGVMERLGLGPDQLLSDNPKLVYGRMTGWGQEGPLAHAAGHDINYIALAGNLHTYGRQGEKPTPPINLAGDFAGGAMFLAFGLLAGIMSARQTGKGQVVDAAMIDGAGLLSAMTWTFFNSGMWSEERGTNLLDTGAHFYDTYETSDGKWISLGAIEPQFYAQFRELTGLSDNEKFDEQMNPKAWPELKAELVDVFKTRTRDEWCDLLEGTDVCFAPVLSMAEAPSHPHISARNGYVQVGQDWQPAPAPRFSGADAILPSNPPVPGHDTGEILAELGYGAEKIQELRDAHIIN